MKALGDIVRPTAEQLSIFSNMKAGVTVIRGAAGSGKTTTALLKLKAEVNYHLSRARRAQRIEPIKVLVLAFNRTLEGYIRELSMDSIPVNVSLEISTFARWSMELLNISKILSKEDKDSILREYGQGLNLDNDFLIDEVDYILGRFPPENLENYITARRDGRGSTPRMEQGTRRKLLDEVVIPYIEYKEQNDLWDWNDLAVYLATNQVEHYDVVVVDETQDFSANQIRAIMNQLAHEHSVTFVIDSAQKIYQKAFTWRDVGVTVNSQNSWSLRNNYRNTIQIARFAAGIINGVEVDDNGCLPRFESVTREGALPKVVIGRFSQQVDFAINFIREHVDLVSESVAFLHPKGHGWFDFLKQQLKSSSLDYVTITKKSEWPQGTENIALSTLHSAKGLEFDHVFILGLDSESMPAIFDEDNNIDQEELSLMRRLVAMGIGRARNTVVIGYKEENKPYIAEHFEEGTFEKISL